MKIKGTTIFGIFLIVICMIFLVTALNYNSKSARLVPTIVLTVTLIMLFMQVSSDFFPAFGSKIKFMTSGGLMSSFESYLGKTENNKERKNNYEEIKILAWLIFLLITNYFLGFLLGNGLFLMLFLRFPAKQTWKVSAQVTTGGMIFIWLMFGVILKMPLAPTFL